MTAPLEPAPTDWYSEWAVDGLWFTRDAAWYSTLRPTELDGLDVGSFSITDADIITLLEAVAFSYSLGGDQPDLNVFADSYSVVDADVHADADLSPTGKAVSISTVQAAAALVEVDLAVDAVSYSLGCAEPEAEAGSGADSYSIVDAAVQIAVTATTAGFASSISTASASASNEELVEVTGSALSFSLGGADPEAEAGSGADSYSVVTSTLELATSVTGSAASISTPNAAVASEDLVETIGSALSYSLGGADPDAEAGSGADSYSVVASTLALGISATGSAASVSTPNAAVASEDLVETIGSALSYSLGGADPEAEAGSGADSYSVVASTLALAVSATGSAASVSSAGATVASEDLIATSGSALSYSLGGADPEAEAGSGADSYSVVASTLALGISATGSAASVSTPSATVASENLVVVTGSALSYSLGGADPEAEAGSGADSYSVVDSMVALATSTAGSAASISTPGATVASENLIATSGSALSYSLGGADPEAEAGSGADSYSVVASTLALGVSATGSAASTSTPSATVASETLTVVTGSALSYSLGGADPEAEAGSGADSYSIAASTVSLGLSAAGSAASTSVSGATVTSETLTVVTGSALSYSLGGADPEAEAGSGADSYSLVASTLALALPVTGAAASISTPTAAVTSETVTVVTGSALSYSLGGADPETEAGSRADSYSIVASMVALGFSAAGSAASTSVAGAEVVSETLTVVTGSAFSYSLGGAEPETEAGSGADSYSVVASTVALDVSAAGSAVSVSVADASFTSEVDASTTFTASGSAIAYGRFSAQQRFVQFREILEDAIFDTPPWAEGITMLAIGAGGGGYALNGGGGEWRVLETNISELTDNIDDEIADDIEVSNFRFDVSLGKGGGADGSPSNASIGASISSPSLEVFDFYLPLDYVEGQPGFANAGGGAATGGNINGGTDCQIPGTPTSGPRTFFGGTLNNVPGGGGSPGRPGQDGTVWVGVDSQPVSKTFDPSGPVEIINVLAVNQFVVPGAYSFNLPLKTSQVQVAVVGGGAGGGGGSQFLNGHGGNGGRWAAYENPFIVSQLLYAAGLTQSDLTRLWVEGVVGQGGAGGAPSGNNAVGAAGGSSTLTLKCQVGATIYTLGTTRTGAGGEPIPGGVGSRFQNGLAVVGGNLSSGRDMAFAFSGRPFTYKGGAEKAAFNPITIFARAPENGNVPGGGADGGNAGGLGAAITNGMRGGSGAVNIAYLYASASASARNTEERIDE